MSDAAAPAVAAPKVKKAAAPKVKKVAKPATHPKFGEMILAAVTALKEKKGSSNQAIKKYILATYKVEEKSVTKNTKVNLVRMVTAGDLKQVKGTGASGSFKLAVKAAPKPKKAAAKSPKKAAKKPVAKKAAKSPKKAAKKTATKKAAKPAKKAAKSPAKKAAKKPVAKKAAKKPAAKKVAKK